MTQSDLATFRAMVRHVLQLDEDLRPSRFWEIYGKHNEELLMRYGVENFKRTVNQNYFNWVLPEDLDSQQRRLRADWEVRPDPAALQVELEDWELLRVGAVERSPFSDPAVRARYAEFVGLLWHHVRASDASGLLDKLTEPELGNPIRTRLRGRLISQDLANSVKERNTFLAGYEGAARGAPPRVVGELGAGYGRVAYVLLASEPVRYVIIDLPPALFVSQWYLGQLFAERRIFRFRPFQSFREIDAELAAADIAFLTPDQFYLLPDGYFDLFLTISSLAEMTPSQVSQYIGLMCCKTKSRIYIKQWREWTNRADGVTLSQPDYDLLPGWHKSVDRIDSVQDRFFETLWEAD